MTVAGIHLLRERHYTADLRNCSMINNGPKREKIA